jgi:predicted DNA-binding protein
MVNIFLTIGETCITICITGRGVNRMISVRLSQRLDNKLADLSEREKVTKSELIKEALEKYLDDYEQKSEPYALGEDLFGKYGSGSGDRSVTYKEKVRAKIGAKIPR